MNKFISNLKTSKLKVFISYSHKDSMYAWFASMLLRAVGYEVVIDKACFRCGEDWEEEVKSSISSADIFMLIWSRNAKSSLNVEYEIDLALDKLKNARLSTFRLLPISIETLEMAPPPEKLSSKHFSEPATVWHKLLAFS